MAPTAKSNPIPDRYRRVTPALIVNGGVKALEFYAEVFDATERMRFPGPDGTVAHAEIEIGEGPANGTKTHTRERQRHHSSRSLRIFLMSATLYY